MTRCITKTPGPSAVFRPAALLPNCVPRVVVPRKVQLLTRSTRRVRLMASFVQSGLTHCQNLEWVYESDCSSFGNSAGKLRERLPERGRTQRPCCATTRQRQKSMFPNEQLFEDEGLRSRQLHQYR